MNKQIYTHAQVIKALTENPNTHLQDCYFAYFPMRLSGLGITERIKDGKSRLINRGKELFANNEFMDAYSSVAICVTHPQDNGEYRPLGFEDADLIVGNSIHAFIRENEIWIIARIHNQKLVDLLLENEFSTSPYFISEEVENVLDNGDILFDERPILCNHLAIVANGYWDKKTNNNPIGKELSMEDAKIDNEIKVDNDKVDNEVEKIDSDTKDNDTKIDNENNPDSDTKIDNKVDNDIENDKVDNDCKKVDNEAIQASIDYNTLLDNYNALKAQVDALIENSEAAKTDAELKEKDEVIEAINDIADSSEFIEKPRVRANEDAKAVLQRFLKTNKKHISEKYHALADSMPDSVYSIAKIDVLQDMRNNLKIKHKEAGVAKNGWVMRNNEIAGFKF